MDVQELCAALEEGEALFTLLGRIFYGVPDRALIAQAADLRIFDEIPFVPEEDCAQARELLVRWTNGCARPFGDADFDAVNVEYARMFVGFRKVIAPVWESVYFNRDRMVFQHQTFEVRRMYRKWGLEVEGLSHEPDDHLAYELLFIALLMGVARERLVAGDLNGAHEAVADLSAFVSRHPLMWVPLWYPLVVEKSTSDFYRGYALLVMAALKRVETVSSTWLDACTAHMAMAV